MITQAAGKHSAVRVELSVDRFVATCHQGAWCSQVEFGRSFGPLV